VKAVPWANTLEAVASKAQTATIVGNRIRVFMRFLSAETVLAYQTTHLPEFMAHRVAARNRGGETVQPLSLEPCGVSS
jgi:hypothetical protein